MLIAYAFESAEAMRKLLSQISILILVCLTTACATTNTSVSEKSFTGDSSLRNELIRNGDRISLYTTDEKEIVMLVSNYNSEGVSGFVTAIYDKPADEFYFYDEVDGETVNHQEIKAIELDHIGLLNRTDSSSTSKIYLPNISGSDVALGAGMLLGCIALAVLQVDCSRL